MIFAIMLTRRVAFDAGPRFNSNWGWGAAIAVVLFAAILWMLTSWGGIATEGAPLSTRADSIRELGVALVAPQGYVLAFELASVLLLAALIGAVVVAWERK
jgi:NADH-quinone oxidoreductase subunit J